MFYVGFLPPKPSKAPSRTRWSITQSSFICYPPSCSEIKPFYMSSSVSDTVPENRIAINGSFPPDRNKNSQLWPVTRPEMPSSPLPLLPASKTLSKSIKITLYNAIRLTKYFGSLRLCMRKNEVFGESSAVQEAPKSLLAPKSCWPLKLCPAGLHLDRKGRGLVMGFFRIASVSFNGQA